MNTAFMPYTELLERDRAMTEEERDRAMAGWRRYCRTAHVGRHNRMCRRLLKARA